MGPTPSNTCPWKSSAPMTLQVTRWLNTHMGYHIKMPCITDTSTQLLGGRMCRILDRKSAALMYQRHGVPIVLFAFRGDHISLPVQKNTLPHGQHSPHIWSVSGRPVVMWQRDGMVYSIVGDMHRDDLEQVAKTVQLPLTSACYLQPCRLRGNQRGDGRGDTCDVGGGMLQVSLGLRGTGGKAVLLSGAC